jgi:glycosyltransferase involved in cell wall biosynthesis
VTAVLDVQAAQSVEHPERGIARYVSELAHSLERWVPEVVAAYSYNPDLPIPQSLQPLADAGRLVSSDALRRGDAALYHVSSPFEGPSLARMLPHAIRLQGTPVAAMLYDLIPLIFPEQYLNDARHRARYRARLELVRGADVVTVLSEHARGDAIAYLGIPADRIVVIGAAPSERFHPADELHTASNTVRAAFPWIRDGYVLYPGGSDWRKNVDGLLRGYAELDPGHRHAHPLVVTGRFSDTQRDVALTMAMESGVRDDVHFVGVVSDELLLALYQAAALVVFPSRYEGYGLPVAEAMRCRAPVVAARSSSLLELVRDDAALFDADAPESLTAVLERAFTDPAWLHALRSAELPAGHTWQDVAHRTADVYRRFERRPGRRRARPRIAMVAPMPPVPTGIADHSYRLAEALERQADVDVFVEDPDAVRAPAGVGLHLLQHLDRAQSTRGGLDAVVHCWGNNAFHAASLPVMREWPGLVVAHDVAVAGLYQWCSIERSDLVPRGFREALHDMYGEALNPALAALEHPTYADVDALDVCMARDVIGWSERFLVHSEEAAAMARADARAEHVHQVGLLPFAIAPGRPRTRPHRIGDPPIIACFGVTQASKQVDRVLEAFALLHVDRPSLVLAFVGDVLYGTRQSLRTWAERLGVAHAVLFTGRIAREQYEAWLSTADVAVQLRGTWGGEASAAVGDALAWGVPTIVTDVGWCRGLPADAASRVVVDVDTDELAQHIECLLLEPELRALRSQTGAAYAAANSFDRTADVLLDLVRAV